MQHCSGRVIEPLSALYAPGPGPPGSPQDVFPWLRR